jgi:hypothetical protein
VTTIDELRRGQAVVLRFYGSVNGPYTEPARFLGIIGKGENRRAVFESVDETGSEYPWNAYRFENDWAFGTGADRLELVRVFDPAIGKAVA